MFAEISDVNWFVKTVFSIVMCLMSFVGVSQSINELNEKQKTQKLSRGEEYALLGGESYLNFNYRAALQYNFQALEHLELSGNELLISEIKNEIGNVYGFRSLYELSTKFYLEALELISNMPEEENRARGLQMNIGLNYYELGDKKTAERYYREAMDGFEIQNALDTSSLIIMCSNISDYLLEVGKSEEANDTLTHVERFYDALDPVDQAMIIEARASYFMKTGMMDTARTLYTQLVELDTSEIIKASYYLGIAELNILEGHFDLATTYIENAIEVAREFELNLNILQAYKLYQDLYEEKGDYAQVYHYLNLQAELKDSLYNKEDLNDLNELMMNHEVNLIKAINEEKLALVKKEEKLSVSQYVLVIVVLFIATVILISISLRVKSRRVLGDLKLNAVQMEKEYLQSQIDFKEKDLYSFTSYISENKGVISALKTKINKLRARSSNQEIDQIYREIIHYVSNNDSVGSGISVQGQQDFMFKLDSIEPALTIKEKRMCGLIVQEKSSREIAEEFNVEPASIDKSRYRLRKKLGVDRQTSLMDYLKSL